MFTLADKRIVKNWPVPVSAPKDGGGATEQAMKADIKLMSTEQMLAEIKAEESAIESVADAIAYQKSFVRKYVRGLDDIADTNGEAIAYSADVLERVLDIPYARRALYEAVWDASRGAPTKNSLPGLDG